MVFDNLRSAVNNTHGSLHQAFLAWDKKGSGELTKARLRVGLRGCRGANERDVEQFMAELFSDDQMERVTFNRLFQAFHEGEKRFAEDDINAVHPKSSLNRTVSPGHSIQTNDELRKNIISTNTPERVLLGQDANTNLLKHQPVLSVRSSQQGGAATSTSYRTPPRNEEGPSHKNTPIKKMNHSPSVERRLNFDVEEDDRDVTLISPKSNESTSSILRTGWRPSPGRQQQQPMKRQSPDHLQHDIVFPSDSSILSSTSPSRPSSPSSARFQRIREARRSSPFRDEDYHFKKPLMSLASSAPDFSSNASPSSPMFDLAERKLFESRVAAKAPSSSSSSPYNIQRSSSSSHTVGLPRKAVVGYQQRIRTSLLDDLSVKTPERTSFGTVNASGSGMYGTSRGNVDQRRSYDNNESNVEQYSKKDSYVFDRFLQPSQTTSIISEKDKLFDDEVDGLECDAPYGDLLRNNKHDKLNPTIKNELKVMLMTMAKDTPSTPAELVISPSDLRRCIHTVDPSLSRSEIICLARALLDGSFSPHRMRIGKVLRNLEKL